MALRSLTHLVAVVGAFGCLTAPVLADVPEVIATDRPDFTESSLAVPRGYFQYEMGGTWVRGPRNFRQWNGPELLLRHGLDEWTELRVETPQFFSLRDGRRVSGASDMAVGLKHQLGPVGDWGLALIPMLSIPTGAEALTSGGVDPDISAAWSRSLTDRLGISGLFGVGWLTRGDGRQFNLTSTVSLGWSLGSRWATFLEYAGSFPDGGSDVHLAHGGVTFLFNKVTQADFHLAVGLNRSSPDLLIGAGLSQRF